ncbi:putative RNA-directed DNA polymerase from transposon BS [Trichonephila clavipes]|nr:putative RNA-directed DNA polymerase from transposon BS [Trichonephila clavipes]
MDPEILCPGKGLVLPNISIDTIATNSRFLILSLPNHEMSQKSPFAIQKALKGIGGDPKSVKKLRSGDLLIETVSALQTKSFLSAKVFLDCPLIVTPHRSLNSCRGVISEPDLFVRLEAEILEGFLTKGLLKCAAVGHFSTDCTLEPKCINCLQAHSADSKLCPKWKAEKQIQEIKTNKNIAYIEARKLIAPPPLTLTYSQAAKSSITSASTQTDENITKIKCPLLELLQPASSNSKQNKTTSIPTVSTSSTQAHLLRSTSTISKSQPHIPKIPVSNDLPSVTIPSTSAILPTIQKEALLPIPILTSTTTSFTGNSLNTSSSSLKTDTRLFPTTSNKFAALSTEIRPSVSLSESEATASNNEPSNTSKISKRLKRNSKNRKRRAKEQKAEIEVKMTPHTPKKSYIHYDSEEEDMIIYNVDEKLMDDHVRSGYSHFLTPTRNRRN